MRRFLPLMANFWGFGAFALLMPLLVVHYGDLGFGGVQIGLLTGLPPIISTFGAPLWTSLADRTGRHSRIWVSLGLVAIALTVLLTVAVEFWAVLGVLLMFNVATSPFVSFTDTATMHMLGDEKHMYGRVRVGGTLGFAGFAWVGGIIAEGSGVTTSFYASAAVLGIALVFIRRLEFTETGSPEDGRDAGLAAMLREPHWLVFASVGVAGGIGFVLAAAYTYPFMQALGATASTIGLAIFLGTICEVPVLFWGNRFLAALRPFTLLLATVLFTGARFVAMSFAGSVGVVMFWMLSHGLTFVLMWVAAVAYADAHAPAGRKATAQGLFAASSTGVGAAVGGLAAGPILSTWGADTLYLLGGLAIVAIAGVAGVVGLRTGPAAKPV